jgi:hypothetical protein
VGGAVVVGVDAAAQVTTTVLVVFCDVVSLVGHVMVDDCPLASDQLVAAESAGLLANSTSAKADRRIAGMRRIGVLARGRGRDGPSDTISLHSGSLTVLRTLRVAQSG